MVVVSLAAVLTIYWLVSGKTNNVPDSLPAAQKSPVIKNSTDIAVYYVKFTEADTYLVREIHRVPYTADGPTAAINELISTNPQTAGSLRILPANTRLLGISINDGRATVNFSHEILSANAGSSGEALGIQSIVNTLTEFPQIKEVSFQVDGKQDSRTMDWWGHVGLYEQPFKRNMEKVYEPAVWVTHPVEEQVSGVPLLVKGSVRATGDRIYARLMDESGKKIAEESTPSHESQGRDNFEIKITFVPPGKGKGVLEVFTRSGQGTPQGLVRIPIQWP
ncbi:MAG: GerMN domain-containing protein [Desulfocucumaceae bacterium]